MKNWYLVVVSLIGLQSIEAADTEVTQHSQVEIEIDPDEEEYYYEDDDGPEIWIGPGVYYGVWFDNEYEYQRWYKDRYYHRYDYEDDQHHQDRKGNHE